MIVMPSCCGSFFPSSSMSTTYDTPFHRIQGILFPFYVLFIPLYLFYDVDFSGCLALLVSLPGLCFIIHVYKYSVVALLLGFLFYWRFLILPFHFLLRWFHRFFYVFFLPVLVLPLDGNPRWQRYDLIPPTTPSTIPMIATSRSIPSITLRTRICKSLIDCTTTVFTLFSFLHISLFSLVGSLASFYSTFPQLPLPSSPSPTFLLVAHQFARESDPFPYHRTPKKKNQTMEYRLVTCICIRYYSFLPSSFDDSPSSPPVSDIPLLAVP